MLTRRQFIAVTAAGSALMAMGMNEAAGKRMRLVLPDDDMAAQGGRRIPLLADVDIVVVGGSSRAVAAAAAAAANGSKVFLAAGLPYLGDDICGSMLYDLSEEESLQSGLAKKLFEGKEYPTPSHIKKTLQDELIDNGADFLLSSYVTDVLKDTDGRVCGVVIANRSGRQAVRAKFVIDATHEASVARMAGGQFSEFVGGRREFQFTVLGNSPKSGEGIVKAEVLPKPVRWNGRDFPLTRYTIEQDVREHSYAALMEAEQKARMLVWDPDQTDSSDLLWYIPSQEIECQGRFEGGIPSLRMFPPEALKPKGVEGLYVLGPCAGFSRKDAASLMRPASSLVLGEMLGCRLADALPGISAPSAAKVDVCGSEGMNLGQIGEILKPLRKIDKQEWVDSPAGAIPILGRYDVVVLGGGTAGATAGISSAKNGARTLMLEYLHGLGGLTTMGLIGVYWDGFRGGYTAQIDKAVRAMAPSDHPRQTHAEGRFVGDWKMEWLRREYLGAGGELWFGVLGCGALVEKGTVKGVVISTPFGRGVVLSKVLVDSTGSADIAIAAGAQYDYTGAGTLAVQGAGAGKHDPLDYSVNNDWLFIDDTDILDVSRVFVQQKEKFKSSYDTVKIPQTRERRRVVGEHVISVYDILNHRRYPDTISYHLSSFDTHGYVVDPFFLLSPPMKKHVKYDADVPLRSLLPKGLEGILTTGLGASAHRDAMPVIRMQPCLQNQGYAVGYLSALAVREGVALRKVDIKKVQKHLVAIGNLPERVLTDTEFKGFSSREMKAASDTVGDNYKGLEVLLTDHRKCLDLMRDKMKEQHTPEEKVIYASILCMLGDKGWSAVLKDAVSSYTEWDEGWHYTGMGQFGMCVSRLDALIIALGRSRDESALPVILDKAERLYPEDFFSHFRAVSLACESIASQAACSTLVHLLKMPGMCNHSIDSYREARMMVVPDKNDVSLRNKALKEIHLAKALYKCGDSNGLGEDILKRYSACLQGHYSRCATEVLEGKEV